MSLAELVDVREVLDLIFRIKIDSSRTCKVG